VFTFAENVICQLQASLGAIGRGGGVMGKKTHPVENRFVFGRASTKMGRWIFTSRMSSEKSGALPVAEIYAGTERIGLILCCAS
jgi:hypothetical protein